VKTSSNPLDQISETAMTAATTTAGIVGVADVVTTNTALSFVIMCKE